MVVGDDGDLEVGVESHEQGVAAGDDDAEVWEQVRAGGEKVYRRLGVEADETMKSSIAVRIARLRKKLLDVGVEGVVIESIRNIGYQLLVHIEIS